jgi:hypothetical protein
VCGSTPHFGLFTILIIAYTGSHEIKTPAFKAFHMIFRSIGKKGNSATGPGGEKEYNKNPERYTGC